MTNEQLPTFKAGDEVTCAFFGDEKFILHERLSDCYPLKIVPSSDLSYAFTKDGRSEKEHTHPILKLSRTKEQVEAEEKAKLENQEWYEVSAHHKNSSFPVVWNILYKSKEDFLAEMKRAESDYHWIELRKVR